MKKNIHKIHKTLKKYIVVLTILGFILSICLSYYSNYLEDSRFNAFLRAEKDIQMGGDAELISNWDGTSNVKFNPEIQESIKFNASLSVKIVRANGTVENYWLLK